MGPRAGSISWLPPLKGFGRGPHPPLHLLYRLQLIASSACTTSL